MILAFLLFTFLCNCAWTYFGNHWRRSVPGSWQRAKFMAWARLFRWPAMAYGFFLGFNSFLVVSGNHGETSTFWTVMNFAVLICSPLIVAVDYKRLREELDEDEDDPWNKVKRAARKAKVALAGALSPAVPVAGAA